MGILLKIAQMQAIGVLRARKWSNRRTARELGIDRGTVSKYVRQMETDAGRQNQPNLPTGSVGQDPPAGLSGPASLSQAFHEQSLTGQEMGLSTQRIWQDLRDEYGFGGAYDGVKRYVARLQGSQPSLSSRPDSQAGADRTTASSPGSLPDRPEWQCSEQSPMDAKAPPIPAAAGRLCYNHRDLPATRMVPRRA